MRKNRSKTPSESMGGTRGELVPAREVRRERSEPYHFRRSDAHLTSCTQWALSAVSRKR